MHSRLSVLMTRLVMCRWLSSAWNIRRTIRRTYETCAHLGREQPASAHYSQQDRGPTHSLHTHRTFLTASSRSQTTQGPMELGSTRRLPLVAVDKDKLSCRAIHCHPQRRSPVPSRYLSRSLSSSRTRFSIPLAPAPCQFLGTVRHLSRQCWWHSLDRP